MSLELLNTSAPRGVRPGAAGFCTVGITQGMSAALEERLTLLSGYRWLYPPGEHGAGSNPVAWAHWRIKVAGIEKSVLSRVGDAGFDYTRRSNRLAHHVVVNPTEQSEPGPAWVMMQPGVMRSAWTGEPMIFAEGPDIPQGQSEPRISQTWRDMTGDAGWAGALAESFVKNPAGTACILFSPGAPLLSMVDEALSLLPPALRWQVTFCTYFNDLPAGMSCAWRCCVAGTPAALASARSAELLIDLTQQPGAAPDSPYSRAARLGIGAAQLWEASSRAISTAAEEQGARALAAAMARSAAAAEVEPAGALHGHESSHPAESVHSVGSPLVADSPHAVDSSHATPLLDAAPAVTGVGVTLLPAHADADDASVVEELSDSIKRRPGGLPRLQRRGPHPAFWAVAIVWPVAVAGGAWWYLNDTNAWRHVGDTRRTDAPVQPVRGTPIPATVPAATTHPAPSEARQVPASDLLEARTRLNAQEQTIEQMRREIERLNGALAAAQTQPAVAAVSPEAFSRVQKEATELQAKLDRATRAARVERTADPFHEEEELWAGDGGGPPDAITLEEYAPPASVTVEHTPRQIVIKTQPARPAGTRDALPLEVAVIHISGDRVLLDWIARNRSRLSADGRAWLQLSRVLVHRGQEVIGGARFLPPHSSELNLALDKPVAIAPDLHFKDALSHLSLQAPAKLPRDWTATAKDPSTITFSRTAGASCAFQVQLVLGAGGELDAQSSYSAEMYRLTQTSDDQAARLSDLALAERHAREIVTSLSAGDTEKAKDPARQKDLDAANKQLASARSDAARMRVSKQATDDALAALRAFPPTKIQVINPSNGLVVCALVIDQR